METPLDVLSRAASFVHANEEEGECDSSRRDVSWLSRSTCALWTNYYAIFFVGLRGDKARVRFLWHRDNRRLCEVRARSIRYASDK